jgi:hypothetical protein
MPGKSSKPVYRPPGWEGPAKIERDASGKPIPKKGGKRKTLNKRKTRKARRYSRRR